MGQWESTGSQAASQSVRQTDKHTETDRQTGKGLRTDRQTDGHTCRAAIWQTTDVAFIQNIAFCMSIDCKLFFYQLRSTTADIIVRSKTFKYDIPHRSRKVLPYFCGLCVKRLTSWAMEHFCPWTMRTLVTSDSTTVMWLPVLDTTVLLQAVLLRLVGLTWPKLTHWWKVHLQFPFLPNPVSKPMTNCRSTRSVLHRVKARR